MWRNIWVQSNENTVRKRKIGRDKVYEELKWFERNIEIGKKLRYDFREEEKQKEEKDAQILAVIQQLYKYITVALWDDYTN